MRNDELPENYILDGKYEIVEVIGAGAYGITYKAINLVMGSPVAIKEFFPRGYVGRDNLRNVILDSQDYEAWYQDVMGRFVREANILMQMKKYYGIVQVKNLIKKNSTAYMVMEFIDGKTLEQYLDEYKQSHDGGCMPLREIQKLLIPLLESVQMLHEHEIIHRDINPQNILMNRKGELILIDFGIAKEEPVGTKSSVIFINNREKGAYIAPEVYYHTNEQGPWSDIYSLCGVMFCMISGQEPCNSVSENENLLIQLDIPEMLKKCILTGLHSEADKRLQNVKEMIAYLNGSIQIKKYMLFLLFGFFIMFSLLFLFKPEELKSHNGIQRNQEKLKKVIAIQTQNTILDDLTSFDDFDFDGNGEMFAVTAAKYDKALADEKIYLIEQGEIWYSDGKVTEKIEEIIEDEFAVPVFYKTLNIQMGKEKLWQLIRYYDVDMRRVKSVEIYKLDNGKPTKIKYMQSEGSPVFMDNAGHYLLDYVNGGFTNGGFHFMNKVYINYRKGLCYFLTEELLQEELEGYKNFSTIYKTVEDRIINGDICYLQFFNSFRCSNGLLYVNIIKWPDKESYMASDLGDKRVWNQGQLPIDFQDDNNVGANFYAVFTVEEGRLRLNEIKPGFWIYPAKENEQISSDNWGMEHKSTRLPRNEDAYEAYKNFLGIKKEYTYYSLKDVNGDGVDELFCANDLQKAIESETDLPVLNNNVGCLILGYDGKKVVKITELIPGPEECAFFYGKSGVYWTSRYQTDLICIENNQVSGEFFWSQTPNGLEGIPKVYSINGTDVSEEEYHLSFKELEDMEEMSFQKNKFN